MRQSWPLTGRVEELRFIAAALHPGAPGIVIAGAAGVGKTRLAREVVAALARPGAGSHWVCASGSAQPIPLGAFAGLVDVVESSPFQVVRAVVRTLTGNPPRPVVVAIDDAHLLDPLSAFIIGQLALHRLATLVVTVRTGMATPPEISALWRQHALPRLELQPLSQEECGELLHRVLSSPVDPAAALRLWQLTLGNVFYLRQIVDEELSGGRLRRVGKCWQWSPGPVVAPGLLELVAARLTALPAPVTETVDILALAEPLDTRVMTALTGATALRQAAAAGLTATGRDSGVMRVRLAHPIFGEVRRAKMGRLRARRLRGKVAMALLEADGDQLRSAVLLAESDHPPDPGLFLAAAQTSVLLHDYHLGARLGKLAARAGGGYDAELVAALALMASSRGIEAEELLARLAGSADHDRQTQVALARAGNLRWICVDPEQAAKQLEVAGDSAATAAVRAGFAAADGHPAIAVRMAAEALQEPGLSPLAAMQAVWGMVLGLGLLGRSTEVDAAAERGYAIVRDSVAASSQLFGLTMFQITALTLSGALSAAHTALQAREAELGEAVDPAPVLLTFLHGHLAARHGQLALARERLDGAAPVLLELTGPQVWTVQCLIDLVTVCAQSADPDAAQHWLDVLDRECGRLPGAGFGYLEPELLLARAWVHAAHGVLSEAFPLVTAAATLSSARGQTAHEVHALHVAARLGLRDGAGRAAALASTASGPRARAVAAQLTALRSGSARGLDTAAAMFAAYGDELGAADAAAQAAVLYSGSGLRASAQAALKRARGWAHGTVTPALRAAAQPGALTVREREIAALAAQGFSNKEIAARLEVSVRTVEGHMYRLMAKLGGVSRARLRELLAAAETETG